MSKKNAFTLIELLVVIAIIGLLASIVLVALNSARAKARDVKRRTDLKQIQLALEIYYDDNNGYPSTGGAMWTEGRCNHNQSWVTKPDYSGSNAWIPNLAPNYMAVLPGDPAIGMLNRCYLYASDGQTFYNISAHFGIEGTVDVNDPMVRLLPPTCTTAQNTFTLFTGGQCW